jgi:hypothetical protein
MLVNIEQDILNRLNADFGRAIDSSGGGFGISADWALGDLQIIWEKAEIGALDEKPLPALLAREEFFVRNCSTSEQPARDETISVSYSETDTVNVTQALTTTSGLQVTIPLANAQINFSQVVAVSEVKSTVQQHSRNETTVERITVPATTALLYVFTKRGIQVTAPFEGECIVDAKLLSRHPDGHLLPFTFGMLSDRYPADRRRYQTKGTIMVVRGGSRVEKSYIDKKLDPKNPRDCEQIPNLSSNHLIRLKSRPMLLDALVDSLSAAAGAREITVSLHNGMSISTCNCVANIQVRAKSFGPGFCDTRISNNFGHSVQISAPPFTWSNWEVLNSHIGEMTFTINVSAKCDTGALFEIKYFAA